MSQDTGKGRNTVDQFYTRPETAKLCVEILKRHVNHGPYIEPSAGTGVFLDLIPEAIGYDIDPRHPRIQQCDFLSLSVPEHAVVFGNPPFGRQASTAKKFIRHASEKADVIAFILPRSFQKPSMQRAFPSSFHLEEQVELPTHSFLVNGSPYDVPCVFQLWKRKDIPRQQAEEIQPIGFQYVRHSDEHHLAMRRVGVYAGRCSLPAGQSFQSHYFVKLDNPEKAADVVTASLTYTFPSNTTGPRSLTKSEASLFLSSTLSGTGS